MNSSRTPFDDLEDSDFAQGGSADSPERAEEVAAAVEAAATLMNWEPCAKCRGTGVWGTYKRMQCFACKGTGKRKAGGNARSAAAAKGKITAETNRRADEQKRLEAFERRYPDEWAWITAATNRGDQFAESMIGKIRQWGGLTDAQMAAIQRSAARDAERKVGVSIDVSGLDAAFSVAKAKGAKRASLRTEAITFSLAGSHSRNPGAIYAKSRSGTYLGKIVGGKFSKGFECTAEDVEKIVEAARDPKGAALRYARITGECSICGAELTDKNSIAAGIGPVCATKFGW